MQQKIAEKAAAMAAVPQKKTIQALIKQMEPEIKKALPSVITPERFTRIALSALSTNPQLQECSPKSFLAAMMTSAQLGMEVNTPLGQCYLIPYWNGKTKTQECQFQLGYKGLIDLAYRSGEVLTIEAHAVHENDEFSYEYGLHADLKFVPAKTNRGSVIAYYAMFKTKSGGYAFEVMSIEDVKDHRDKFSKAAGRGFSPWDTSFDEMAKKTVLKKVLKYAPMKTDFSRQLSADDSVKTSISDDMFAEPNEEITAEFAEDEAAAQAEPVKE